MAHGTVKWFSATKGFGFISRAGFVSRDAGGADVFMHHSQIAESGRVEPGDLVRFILDPDGLRAVDVHAVRPVGV
jgi:CspA family cold shock protein